MTLNDYHYFCYFIILFITYSNGDFVPDTNDYDAYGSKIAMNDYFIVLAQNNVQPPKFFIQFAPYNNSKSLSQCSINYPNISSLFVYTVAVGRKQTKNDIHFFFAGELTNGESGPVIGVATVNKTSTACNTSVSYSFQYLNNYQHQEFYIIGVSPNGTYAYGFTNEFVFVYDSKNTSNFHIRNGNSTWNDSTFLPHAVDMNENFGVIAGFVRDDGNRTAKYNPMIYLINFNSSNYFQPYVVHTYQPTASANTWQDLLTNIDANTYSAKYDMSVSIDQKGNVLVGMQFINRVFLFSVNVSNPVNLNNVSRFTNGRSLGNGKSVAWLDNGIAAILINTYSLDYVWSSSQIFFFDIYTNVYNSNSTPLSVFPNRHQLLPKKFSSIFLNIVSSPSTLALLDFYGDILIFNPTQPGFYPTTNDLGSSVSITVPTMCMVGTYKNRTGIHDCSLCPPGTKNPSNASTLCIPCSPDSFCPLGSVYDVPQSALETIHQVIPYPQSPESTIFDEILIHTMFSIGSGRCLVVSPLFWTLIVAAIVVFIIILMEVLYCCVKGTRSNRLRAILKRTLKHTDLIGEGEFWVGGLVSFCIIVLVCFAYSFSNQYLHQYPIETSSPSYFTCDTTMRNAKFETNIQSLAIPFTEAENKMADLLNQQVFTLNMNFINTLIDCSSISLEGQFGTTWSTIRWSYCKNTNSILYLSTELPYQQLSVRITAADVKPVGALRIGLSGPEDKNKHYTLRELGFYQSFNVTDQILAQTLSIGLAITKIINETKPMEGEESDFGGIYIPTFTVDMDSLFVTNDRFVRSALQSTILTITISETPYYVKNVQQPIARLSEVIFRNLLFTVVCLEIFGLIFLSYKLVFKPIYHSCVRRKKHEKQKEVYHEKQSNGDIKNTNHLSTINGEELDYIKCAL